MNGKPVAMPPDFASTWNASSTATECAKALGISLNHAWLLQQRCKAAGIELKKMPHNLPKFDYAAFAEAWNASSSAAEAGERLGLGASMTRDRARRVRDAGFVLKRMKRTIEVHGVQMSVPEYADMIGMSRSAIASRVTKHGTPLGKRKP